LEQCRQPQIGFPIRTERGMIEAIEHPAQDAKDAKAAGK